MDKSQPKMAVDYMQNVAVATITDEKILEQADARRDAPDAVHESGGLTDPLSSGFR